MSKQAGVISLDKTLKWLDKTQGRDKFCKAIQYACRFLKYRMAQNGNKQMEKKVDALFCAMRDARKLFRLFKSFKQYGKLLEILNKLASMKIQDLALNVITRVFFLLYWLFDNLSILSKLGLIQLDSKKMGKNGSTCWFIALLATLILTVKNLIINFLKISALKRNTKMTGNQKMAAFSEIKKSNSKENFTLIKTIGDILPAGQGCEFYKKVFNFDVNEGWCGIGGLVSAIFTSYQLYG